MNDVVAIAEAPGIRQNLRLMLTGAQCRAARALLRWSYRRLAREAKVGSTTVYRIEAIDGVSEQVQVRTLLAIQEALERGGAVFLDPDEQKPGGPGVRLRNRPADEM